MEEIAANWVKWNSLNIENRGKLSMHRFFSQLENFILKSKN